MELSRSELGLALLVLVLTVLADCAPAADCLGARGGAPSLCSQFSVSASGPSFCEFRGMIDGIQFFKYSCRSRMVKPVGPVGMTLNDTEAWNQRCEHLTDLFPELQKALLDNKENIAKAFGTDSLCLQVHMMCQQESNGCHSAFYQFDINGHMCLRFDLKNRSWTELHPGCRSLKETLEGDKYVTSLLVLVSKGDCVKLPNQSTVLDTNAAAIKATTTAPVPAPSKAVIISHNNTLILTLIFILITLGI